MLIIRSIPLASEILFEIKLEIAAVQALFRYFVPKRFFVFSNYFTFEAFSGK